MFTGNPFAALSASMSPAFMQVYLIVMFLLVVAGTLFEVWHKGSAEYFFRNWRKAKAKGVKQLGGGDLAAIAVQTVAVDVLASGEFCNLHRRIAHLLGMYGFVFYVLATVVMVFGYPTPAAPTPGLWSFLWWIGALMICVGGYWFWFFIRVDVAAEGNPWHRVVKADLFILALLATTTFALLWSVFGGVFLFVLFIAAATVLFGTVFWSKFAHMFFKPAAAFQKRVTKADGSMENLPEIPDLSDPAVHQMYPDIPE